ncbi:MULTISPECIES: copper-binding protein [Hyphobacterium]|uniref:Copper-binding protein n=1 Tax=Hyphobacterium vulgare TaxID=1736751 RepID=A0ABV6ZVT1_9PROT
MLSLFLALALATTDHGHDSEDHHHAETAEMVTSTAVADVRSADAEARTALLRHEALTEIGMPAMVMEFHIAEDVDMALFEPGAALTITAVNGENGLTVIAAAPEGGTDHHGGMHHGDVPEGEAHHGEGHH